MKRPKKIIVVRSSPAPGQSGIKELIGCEFPVESFDKEDESVTVNSEIHEGQIVIHPEEYEVTQ